ncbi:MAG: prepilin-type N-terminal cleavage/methylation domain-containing protein, partial [Cardiobacteriaceae bacterium]|nr:prepilin-type N-terminal cleavage/methylation domain-containing protein [Cardiobacteriaceae bacterium]
MKGFTLLEALIVFAVFAVIASFALPSFNGM